MDNPHPKKSGRKIYSRVSASSEEEIFTENIKTKVKALLEKRKPLSTLQCQVQKTTSEKHKIASLLSDNTSHDISQSSYFVERDKDIAFEGNKN